MGGEATCTELTSPRSARAFPDQARKLPGVEKSFSATLWPSFRDDGIVDVTQIRGSNKLVIEVLAALHRFPAVRLSRHFQEHWRSRNRNGSPRSYYTIGDGMHVNEAGSRAAAHVLKSVVDDFPRLKSEVAESADTSQKAAAAIAAAKHMGNHEYDIATAITILGDAQERQGRFKEALNYYRIALEIDPRSKIARARLQQVKNRLRQ